MHNTPSISVLLPTYNEAQNIGPLIDAIFKETPTDTEIIVIDDDSPDKTWSIAQKKAQKDARIRVERRLQNRGLTNSIRRGIELAQGEVIMWMDCDFSMPPEVIPTLLQNIEEGYDIAIGSRFIAGGAQKTAHGKHDSSLAIFFSTLGCTVLRMFLFSSIYDYTSGFIAVRKTVLQRIPLRGDYGEYCIDLLVRAKLLSFRIVEIPYVCRERKEGVSKTAPNFLILLKRIWQYSLQICKLALVRIRFALGGSI